MCANKSLGNGEDHRNRGTGSDRRRGALQAGQFGIAHGELDLGMAKQFLDGNDIGTIIEQLGSHRMTKLMTGDRHTALLRVILHTLVNALYRKRLPLVAPFLNQKDFLLPCRWPSTQTTSYRRSRIGADARMINSGMSVIVPDPIFDELISAVPVTVLFFERQGRQGPRQSSDWLLTISKITC